MKCKKGQALIVLITFAAIASTIIASVLLVSININAASGKIQVGNEALDVAEAGVENALLRLLRDPSYTGETLTVGSGSATITVTGTNPKTITSLGIVGSHRRTIQAVASDSAGVLTVTSWREQ